MRPYFTLLLAAVSPFAHAGPVVNPNGSVMTPNSELTRDQPVATDVSGLLSSESDPHVSFTNGELWVHGNLVDVGPDEAEVSDLANRAILTNAATANLTERLDGKVSKGGDTMTGGLSVPEIEITDGGKVYGARRISAGGYTGNDGDSDPAMFPAGIAGPPMYEWDNYSYAQFPFGLRAGNSTVDEYGFYSIEYIGGYDDRYYAKFPYGLRSGGYVGSSSGFIGLEDDGYGVQEVYAKFPYGLRAENYVGSSSGFIGLEQNPDSGYTQEVYAKFPNGLYSPSTAYVEAYAGGSPSAPLPAYFPNGIIGRDGLVDFFSLDGTTYSNLRPDGTQVATLGLLDSEGYIKSESDPVFTAWLDGSFSNAVLAVGMNVDTNAVAVLNEIADGFGGFPLGAGGTATTIGGLLAALAAAVAWLKKNKVQTLKLDDGSIQTSADGGVAKLDDFFTESNTLLNGRLAYERNETGLKDRAFNALTFDGTEYNLSTALAAVTPTASGQPRDLLIVATATAATTISFTAGTIKGDKPTIDGAGTWLIALTEYAANTWYCRQIKMEDAA